MNDSIISWSLDSIVLELMSAVMVSWIDIMVLDPLSCYSILLHIKGSTADTSNPMQLSLSLSAGIVRHPVFRSISNPCGSLYLLE